MNVQEKNVENVDVFISQKNVVFDDSVDETTGERRHTYYYIDEEQQYVICPSVTQILTKQGISTDFSKIENQQAVKEAALRGTFFHKLVEEYLKKGSKKYMGFFQTAYMINQINKLSEKYNVVGKISEYPMICTLKANDKEFSFGGTADLVLQRENGKDILIDYKTGERHPDSEKWQTSFYKEMYQVNTGREISEIFIINTAEQKVIPIEPVPKNEIVRLLKNEMQNKLYSESQIENKEIQEKLEDIEERYITTLQAKEKFMNENNFKALEERLKKIENEEDDIKKEMVSLSKETGIGKFNFADYNVTVSAATNTKVDLEAFKNKYPEAFIKYLEFAETTYKKPTVTFTMTEEAKERKKEQTQTIEPVMQVAEPEPEIKVRKERIKTPSLF